jgi:hypothetical protein
MAFVDEHIQREASLAKRIISSIFFDTLITASMMIAHASLKYLSTLLGVNNEPGFSWINGISQSYFFIIFFILVIINFIRIFKSEATFILSLNPFRQDKDSEEKIDPINSQENTQNRNEVSKFD